MKSKNHILTLLENGLSFNTISMLNDNQIKLLSEKFTKKGETKEQTIPQNTKLVTKPPQPSYQVNPNSKTMINGLEVDTTGGKTVVTPLKEIGEESEIKEKFESKAQQGLFWAKCKNSTGKTKKKWCDMAKEFSDSTSKKQYKDMPEKKHPEKTVKRTKKKKTNEELERFLENKILNMLDEYVDPTITKGQMLDTLNEKTNSYILKNPKKMSMFSNESGIEMKKGMDKPIGKLFSMGKLEEDTKEKEKTKEKDKTKERRRKNPFKDPNPDVEENPKADTKEKERTKEKEKTKTPTRRKNPFKDPNPDVEEKPKAKMEKQQGDFIDMIMNALNFN